MDQCHGAGDRRRQECLRKRHVQCCKSAAFILMCFSSLVLLLKMNTLLLAEEQGENMLQLCLKCFFGMQCH